MTIETKSLSDAQANWQSVTPGRSQQYADRAAASVGKWAQKTTAGIPNYQQAVAGASVANRIRANVAGRGSQRYPAKIRAVGASRFSAGVQAAGGDYSQGFAPYLQVIQGVTLPAKGPRGDPRNYDLTRAVGDALHNARIRATASGG